MHYTNKYRRMKHAGNPFTAACGIVAVQVIGRCNCLISAKKSSGETPIQRYAYCLYNNCLSNAKNAWIRIMSSCGNDNCVKQDHLTAIYRPKSKDALYIAQNLKSIGLEQLAHIHNVPVNLLSEYVKGALVY